MKSSLTQELFPILCLTLTLSACGNGEPPKSNGGPAKIPAPNVSKAKDIALRTTINCGSSDSCDASVAMLAATDNDGVSFCSSTLIAENLLLTNSHCIPADLKGGHAACGERIFAFFPDAEGFSKQKMDCQEVVVASDISKDKGAFIKPDYAVIRLSQAAKRKVKSIPQAPFGFTAGTSYSLFVVDPTIINGNEPKAIGTMTKKSCTTLFGSLFNDEPTSSLAENITFIGKECNVIHGNSGSALLDDQGHIRGLIQAGVSEEGAKSMENGLHYYNLIDGTISSQLYFGTNLGRLVIDTQNGEFKREGYQIAFSEARLRGDRDYFLNHSDESLKQIYLKFEKENPNVQWRLQEIDPKSKLIKASPESGYYYFYAALAPLCISASLASKNLDDFEFTPPSIVSRMKFTKYLEPRYFEPKEMDNYKSALPLSKLKMHVSSKNLLTQSETKATFDVVGQDGTTNSFEELIRICQ